MAQHPQQATSERPLAECESEENEPMPQLIARTLAAVEGVPIDELPPLNDAIDTDALAGLFGADSTVDHLSFAYQDYRVVVTADERVAVFER
jgi:hypothetical protein